MESSSPASAASPAAGGRAGRSGPVALGLVAAGLGLVLIYLIGSSRPGSSSLILPLLLGAACSRAGSRCRRRAGTSSLPLPSTTTGALLLLRAVIDDGGSALSVGTLVLGLWGRRDGRSHVDPLRGGAGTPAEGTESRPTAGVLRLPRRPAVPGPQYPGQAHPARIPPTPSRSGRPVGGRARLTQNTRYGGQYGVPGYRRPPFRAPGYDPLHTRSEAPTVAVGAEAPVTPRHRRGVPAGDRTHGERSRTPLGYGRGAGGFPGLGTGAHRAVPDPGAALLRSDAGPTGTGTHRAVPVGTG